MAFVSLFCRVFSVISEHLNKRCAFFILDMNFTLQIGCIFAVAWQKCLKQICPLHTEEQPAKCVFHLYNLYVVSDLCVLTYYDTYDIYLFM